MRVLQNFSMASLKSWLPIPPRSHFSLANIPFGIISTEKDSSPRPAVAIGDHALDLSTFSRDGGFSKLQGFESAKTVFTSPTLNAFAALGRSTHRDVRKYLQAIFAVDTPYPELLEDNEGLKSTALIPIEKIQTHLPLAIGDYTDFFAGKNHAFNVGTLFRGPANALQPNYLHLPVAYHGRASSVVVSGTPLHRPWGQVLTDPTADPKVPTFTPCRRLDIELELGMFISRENGLGKPVSIKEADEYIFGYVLMNDWSARDIQQWEYVPLGPFNAKNFGTSISAWVVLADALEPFRAPGMENTTELRSYLQENRKDFALDIKLEVDLRSK
jgi:fumarylacetoacetase